MTLTSASGYRRACQDLLKRIEKHPRCYFKNLAELQALMGGHEAAYRELGLITKNDSFVLGFCDWIYEAKGVSGAAGIPRAVAELAIRQGIDSEVMFFALAREFLEQWTS